MKSGNNFEPLVSIVVPVYNGELYIEAGLKAILQQSYRNIEVIALDDGSKDSSYKIMQALATTDNRLKVLHHENQGAGATRNEGLNKAKGKYIVFWDSDDSFELTAIEKCVEQAERLNSDIVVYKAMTYNCQTGKRAFLNDGLDALELRGQASLAPQELAEELFNSLLIQIWNKLYRRAFLLEKQVVFQSIARSNDVLFTVQALCSADRLSFINEVLVYYKVGDDQGLHASNDKTPLCFYEALLASRNFLEKQQLEDSYGKSFNRLAIDVIFYNLTVLKTTEARKLVIKKLRQEGLKQLGLEASQAWEEQGCGLQYLALKHSDCFFLIKLSYLLTKAKTYYRQAGLKGVLNKIKMYLGS